MFGIISATRSPRDEAGFVLQPRRESAAQFVELRVAQGRAHIGVGGRMLVPCAGLFDQRLERRILRGIDIGGYASRIILEPNSIQEGLLLVIIARV
jgi:hypothetical protein